MKSVAIGLFLLCTMMLNAAASAQSEADSLLMRGAELLQQEKWPEAVVNFENAARLDPTNLQAQFLLGQAHYMNKNYRKAATAWEKCEANGYRVATVRYNLASAYAQLKDRERTFTWLAQALESGFNRPDILEHDTVFDTLRSDERFQKAIEMADRNLRPCEYDEQYRLLDFWLGDWDVFINDGQKIGASKIQKLAYGCALAEDYEQMDGFVGHNLFYFNNVSGEWKMIWVTGAAIALGGLKEKILITRSESGALRFQGELPDQSGYKVVDRSTVTPVGNDRVDLVIQQSRDGGDNWMTTFSGYYKKRQ